MGSIHLTSKRKRDSKPLSDLSSQVPERYPTPKFPVPSPMFFTRPEWPTLSHSHWALSSTQSFYSYTFSAMFPTQVATSCPKLFIHYSLSLASATIGPGRWYKGKRLWLLSVPSGLPAVLLILPLKVPSEWIDTQLETECSCDPELAWFMNPVSDFSCFWFLAWTFWFCSLTEFGIEERTWRILNLFLNCNCYFPWRFNTSRKTSRYVET